MKKILLAVVALSMFSFTTFAEEVYDVDGAAIECNSELDMAADVNTEEEKENTTGSVKN